MYIVYTRFLCVHETFVRSCPDFRAFHVQAIVRSFMFPDRAEISRIICVRK